MWNEANEIVRQNVNPFQQHANCSRNWFPGCVGFSSRAEASWSRAGGKADSCAVFGAVESADLRVDPDVRFRAASGADFSDAACADLEGESFRNCGAGLRVDCRAESCVEWHNEYIDDYCYVLLQLRRPRSRKPNRLPIRRLIPLEGRQLR